MANLSAGPLTISDAKRDFQPVAAKHYLQLRDEHFQRAAEGEPGPQAGQTGKNGPKPKRETHEKTSVFRGSAEIFASLRTAGLGDEGLEPPTSSL